MKNGLKLLTELNTLVWTSKQEAEAALKTAAEQARAAELAAAAAAANAAAKANSLATAAGVAAAGGSWPAAGSKSGRGRRGVGCLFQVFSISGFLCWWGRVGWVSWGEGQ